jgi:UTP:GlnB (protein PII) uridylyltransferase
MTVFDSSLPTHPRPDYGRPGASVEASGHQHSIRLWGPLPRVWTSRFAAGLSRRGLDIQRGFVRESVAGWAAEFLVSRAHEATDPCSLDFVQMATHEPPDEGQQPVELTHFNLDGCPDLGCALYLEVRGQDSPGFLGRMLGLLERHGLSPREMSVSRVDGLVYDRFFLRTQTGQVPSDETREMLAAELSARVVTAN